MIHRQAGFVRPIVLCSVFLLWGVVIVGCLAPEPSEEEIETQWAASAHADVESPSFTNWDEDDPPVVPESCARCHSTSGYHDFLGLDGAAPGQVDHPVPVGETVECEACHNEGVRGDHVVVMPSGFELAHLGGNASCSDCHQGRASTVSVNEAVADLDDDAIDAELSFINIHNNPAAPMQHGTEARSGYEYANRTYAGYYGHVAGFATCTECHQPHSLEIPVRSCSVCHLGAKTRDDLKQIRLSKVDYDGDGDVAEGLAGEIDTLRERLLFVLQVYTAANADLDTIAYVEHFPYFTDEAGEAYSTWTPRLLRAAYNYQYATKGKGSYAHNAPYMMQLLYDSLEDLGANMAGTVRPE